jgi:hypothetical protein
MMPQLFAPAVHPKIYEAHGQTMCGCQEQLLTRAREANADALLSYGIRAAKSQVAYARALSSSRRAQVLVGEGAGREQAWEAEQHFRARTASLKHLAEAVEEFRRSMEPGQPPSRSIGR